MKQQMHTINMYKYFNMLNQLIETQVVSGYDQLLQPQPRSII